MNRNDFFNKLKAEGLEEFYAYDGRKKYVDGDSVYVNGKFQNTYNAYGVYKRSDRRYVVFITDSERGLILIEKINNSEEEAFDFLYSRILNYKTIYSDHY